jgi:hypothetical protein
MPGDHEFERFESQPAIAKTLQDQITQFAATKLMTAGSNSFSPNAISTGDGFNLFIDLFSPSNFRRSKFPAPLAPRIKPNNSIGQRRPNNPYETAPFTLRYHRLNIRLSNPRLAYSSKRVCPRLQQARQQMRRLLDRHFEVGPNCPTKAHLFLLSFTSVRLNSTTDIDTLIIQPQTKVALKTLKNWGAQLKHNPKFRNFPPDTNEPIDHRSILFVSHIAVKDAQPFQLDESLCALTACVHLGYLISVLSSYSPHFNIYLSTLTLWIMLILTSFCHLRRFPVGRGSYLSKTSPTLTNERS